MNRTRFGVTLSETLASIAAFVPVMCMALPMGNASRQASHTRGDAANLRIIHGGLERFASSNGGRYPLPSAVDRFNATEFTSSDPSQKDRTGAVWSLMIFNHLVPTAGVYVSPLETNPNVQAISRELYDSVRPGDPVVPSVLRPFNAANTIDPINAVYDPSFKGTPFDEPLNGLSDVDLAFGQPGVISNNSYAHTPLVGRYLRQWRTGALGARAILSLRGPRFQGDTTAMQVEDWQLTDDEFGAGSNTLGFLGKDDLWLGNIFFSDGSVRAEVDAFLRDRPLQFLTGGGENGGPVVVVEEFPDNIFVSEGSPIESTIENRDDTYLRTWAEGIDRSRRVRARDFTDPRRRVIWID
ncbi:MAG: hypothetical protein Tsb0013_19510 [Phycisphaerales bacterium]